MSRWGGRTAVVVCLLLLVSATGGTVVGAGDGATAIASAERETRAMEQVTSPSTTNNTTATRHENPYQSDESSDLGAVEQHLAELLAGRLSEGAVQLNRGEYDRARRLLGDDYSEKWGQYVDVAGEVGTEQTAERLSETRETQASYTSTVSEFQATYEAYQEAKRNGNDTRARELARRLIELADDANQTATQLAESYGGLENQTSVSFSTATEAVAATQANVTSIEETVTSEELVRTQLSVTTAADSLSFTNPASFSGRLTTQDGAGIGGARIVLPIAGRNVTTTTTETGSFTLQYRPVRLPVRTSSLTIQYVPASTSVYLGANTTQSIQVEPVTGALALTAAPTETAFGETVTIRGTLMVEETPVPRAPVTIALGGTTLGTIETTQQGDFTLTTSIPATIPAGSHQLHVSMAESGRAVTASPATDEVTLQPTPTTLTATGRLVNQSTGRVRIDGSLRLENGSTVANQPVALRINGTPVDTVETSRNGTYSSTISVSPAILREGQNVTITAVFTGQGTNLGAAQNQTSVRVPSGSAQAPAVSDLLDWVLGLANLERGGAFLASITWIDRFRALPGWMQAGVALILVFLSGFGVSLYRRKQESSSAAPPSGTTQRAQADTEGTPLESPLAAARVVLREGDTNGTIEVIYGQVRRYLAPELEVSSEATHWEFFAACQANLSDTRSKAVQQLTEWYEQAAYGPDDVSTATAREALQLAASLFESESETEPTEQTVTDGGGTEDDS